MVAASLCTLPFPRRNVFCASPSPRYSTGCWTRVCARKPRSRCNEPVWAATALGSGLPDRQAEQRARSLAPSASPPCLSPDLPYGPSLLQGCEPGPPLRVAALLSGGVDSSVALALAQRAGHEVHAFYLQIWFQEDFRNTWAACPWEDDLEQCREVGTL